MPSIKDYSYEWMLEKAFKLMPKKTSRAQRFTLPKAIAMTVGSYTTVRNFKEIHSTLRRDPKHLSRFLLKKIGVAGAIDEQAGTLVLHGKVSAATINRLLEIYVKKYVICPTCGSWDTMLKRQGRIWILRCEACGAETSVEPV